MSQALPASQRTPSRGPATSIPLLQRTPSNANPPMHCKPLEETSETMQAVWGTKMASSQKTNFGNVLHLVSSVEERESRNVAALHELKSDLADVGNSSQELELSQQSALREVYILLQKSGEQMAMASKRELEKLELAFLHLHQGIEEERDTCRLLRMQNKKLAKDLTNANIVAADACEELEKERKARELLEEVCNDLARGIGEDKAQLEQLKQEQEKYRERLEEELKLMRIVAEWQDDGVKENYPQVNVWRLGGDSKQCVSSPKTSSKLETLVQMSEVHGQRETLIGDKQRGCISETRRLRKLRQQLQTRRERKRHNVSLSNGIMIEESARLNQSLGIKSSKGLNKRYSVCTHPGNHVKADMVSSMTYSFSKDDVKSCIMRVSAATGLQESAPHAQNMGAAGTGQEQRFSGVRDGDGHVHHHSGNSDVHRSTGGRMMDFSDIKVDHIFFESVNEELKATAYDKLSQEVSGSRDATVNIQGLAMDLSSHSDEAGGGTMAKCTQGCKDMKKVEENAENDMLSTIQESNNANLEGTAFTWDCETMKKLLPWELTSARSLPLPCFCPPSSDALSALGGFMKHRFKACSLSPPSVQDVQSGLYSHADTTEGRMAKETANQQPLGCIKENSLGAQLVRALEVVKETRRTKPSFCFSPL